MKKENYYLSILIQFKLYRDKLRVRWQRVYDFNINFSDWVKLREKNLPMESSGTAFTLEFFVYFVHF